MPSRFATKMLLLLDDDNTGLIEHYSSLELFELYKETKPHYLHFTDCEDHRGYLPRRLVVEQGAQSRSRVPNPMFSAQET